MKHIKTFESFSINEEAGILSGAKKFLTGHESKEAKKSAESDFMDSLKKAEDRMNANPKNFSQSEDWEKHRKFILEKAKADSFKGGLRVQKSRAGKLVIVYDSGVTGLQQLAAGAASRTSNPLG